MTLCSFVHRIATATTLSFVLAACSAEDPKLALPPADGGALEAASPPPDAAPNEDAGSPTTADSGSPCASIADEGDVVTYVVEAADPPAPAGGTILDGTYVLTSGTFFTGPGGESGLGDKRSMTIRVTGTVVEGARTEGTWRFTYTIDGATLHMTETCPRQHLEDLGYSATPTSLTLFVADDDGTIRLGFEKLR